MSGIQIAYYVSTGILWLCIIINVVLILRNRKLNKDCMRLITLCDMTLDDVKGLRKRWVEKIMEVSEDGRQDEPTEDTGDTG